MAVAAVEAANSEEAVPVVARVGSAPADASEDSGCCQKEEEEDVF